MMITRVGVAGIGNMGSKHAEYIASGGVAGAVLSCVCDVDSNRLDWAKGKFGDAVACFSDFDEMVSSGELDAVLVATRHYSHPEMAIKAFDKKLHVLVEKPAGVYTKQVREMNETAVRSGKVFGIMFNQRTNPVYQKLKTLADSGELGAIKRVIWIITNWYRPQSYYNSGGWRATWSGEGGGVLLNQSPHQLDLLQWICGMPKNVRAYCHEGKYHNIEVEDDVTAYLEYANGATGVFVTSTGDCPGTNRLEISSDNGKVIIENDKLKFWKLSMPESVFTRENKIGFSAPSNELIEYEIKGENTQHKGIITNWINAIRQGDDLLAPGIEGINSLMLSNAMYLSAWTDSKIELPVDEDLFYKHLQAKIDSHI